MKSILETLLIIITPTYINALAAAADGINANKGSKNIDNKNSIDTVRAVIPVLPPALTPVPLSTKVVTVLVPNNEPVIVAILSAYIIFP